MSYIDLTSTIETMTMLEKRLGIHFGGLSAFLDDEPDSLGEYRMTVSGEIISETDDPPDQPIDIKAAVYDSQGRVIGSAVEMLDNEEFLGFDTFQLNLELPVGDVSAIRVFPS